MNRKLIFTVSLFMTGQVIANYGADHDSGKGTAPVKKARVNTLVFSFAKKSKGQYLCGFKKQR